MAENTMPFDLEAFMEGVNRDRSTEKGTNDRLKRMLMNVASNQGTVTIVPFISKTVGNIYSKIERVREFNGQTSLIDSGQAWYKILPLEKYGKMTAEQLELYNEVVGLYDAVRETEEFDYDTIRVRNYSLFTGVLINQVDTDGNQVEDNLDNPVLLVYPSNSPIDALNTAISNKRTLLKERTVAWLQNIITPALEGRKGVMLITFRKSEGPGYAASINLEINTEYSQVIDPERKFSQELASKFDDPLQAFLGWCYDFDNKSYFNETVFKELRDNLKLALKEANGDLDEEPATASETYPNTNGNVDPMMPPIPGVATESPAPAKGKMPF